VTYEKLAWCCWYTW